MSCMGEIWVVRHGETEWSAAGRHTGRRDIPLTEVGEEQARRLALRLNRDWDTVLSSPLSRARRTAELAGFSPLLEPDLVEWDYGKAEGLTTAQLSATKPWSVWDEPLGESLEQLGARAQRVLDKLPPDGDVLIFAHGHVLRVLAALYLGGTPAQGKHFLLDPASIGVLGHEHDYRALKAWNL